jgi:hypothetical protein
MLSSTPRDSAASSLHYLDAQREGLVVELTRF